mmetsp:Transcript_20995/g.45749  ORF Transcript_20995/g.45749 Transcript_20995/m.45749 type:complete len:93 (+) Transcript_20995:119-397(+)
MSHLSSPQAQRTLKFITAVACTAAGIQATFFSTYDDVPGFEGKEHVFSNVQRDTRDFIDKNVYGIDVDAIRRERSSMDVDGSAGMKTPTKVP